MDNSIKQPQQLAALLAPSPTSKTSRKERTGCSYRDLDKELHFALSYLKDVIEEQGETIVLTEMLIQYPDLWTSLQKYFKEYEKIQKVGKLQC